MYGFSCWDGSWGIPTQDTVAMYRKWEQMAGQSTEIPRGGPQSGMVLHPLTPRGGLQQGTCSRPHQIGPNQNTMGTFFQIISQVEVINSLGQQLSLALVFCWWWCFVFVLVTTNQKGTFWWPAIPSFSFTDEKIMSLISAQKHKFTLKESKWIKVAPKLNTPGGVVRPMMPARFPGQEGKTNKQKGS